MRVLSFHTFFSVIQVIDEKKVVLKKIDEYQREIESNDFEYDKVFDSNASQIHVYDRGVRETVENILRGRSATVLAFGQVKDRIYTYYY